MKPQPTIFNVPLTLSPSMQRARVACLQAQAHLDALSGEPAAVAWAAVMDAFWDWVSAPEACP